MRKAFVVLALLLPVFMVRLASAADGPVLVRLTCTSSVGVVMLNDVMPASTQVVQLSAAADDTIRCEALIYGGYRSLEWRGPNDDYGATYVFRTSIGAPRQGGAPYDIGLTVNWDGNPVMAHISVLPDARAQVVTIPPQPGCFVIPPAGPGLPPGVGCVPPAIPYAGTSSITVGY